MWSTMSSPGCETIEAARMDAVDGSGLKDLRAHLDTGEGQPGATGSLEQEAKKTRRNAARMRTISEMTTVAR